MGSQRRPRRDERGGNETEQIITWVYNRLMRSKKVGPADFQVYRDEHDPSAREVSLRPVWNRALHSINALLQLQKVDVKMEHGAIELNQVIKDEAEGRYATNRFQADQHSLEKQQIGELVAYFLGTDRAQGKTIFFGSGSTIFHVGRQMCQPGRKYEQRFVTVNIPLAAYWCEQKTPPVSKISIPAAVLDAQTFRFSTMPGAGWPLTISIVGADGCFYDQENEAVVLYGNEESVATNTSLFIQNTRHSVICCLTSSKITTGFAQTPNTGPPITAPKKGVNRVLVTDDELGEKARTAFKDNGWEIVTKSADWAPILKKMEEGERNQIST